MYSWFTGVTVLQAAPLIINQRNKYGGTYSPHPLLGNACLLHSPQRVHEPVPVARVLWWRLPDVEQRRAVGPGCQTQHFHQTANRLVAYSAPFPGCKGLYCPVGVTLEAEDRHWDVTYTVLFCRMVNTKWRTTGILNEVHAANLCVLKRN